MVNLMSRFSESRSASCIRSKDHPFRGCGRRPHDGDCGECQEYGVLVPAIARPLEDGGYEIIAGHRRTCLKLAGMDEMPVIVKNLDDDESVIIMVDSNLQRENILPSERAKSLSDEAGSHKRKAGRPSRENSSQVATNFRADEVVGAEAGMSKDSVRRFIRLNNLELPLRDKVG